MAGASSSDGNFKGKETIILRDSREKISLFYKTRAYTRGGGLYEHYITERGRGTGH